MNTFETVKSLLLRNNEGIPQGAYDLLTHRREVHFASDPQDAQARMVSLHEMYHASLNDSTAYGLMLIMAGALTRLNHDRFSGLLKQLLESALTTHEMYATTLSLYVVTNGSFNQVLMNDYPTYEQYLQWADPFIDLYPHPIFAYAAINSTARVAMQARNVERFCAVPCEAWPNVDVDSLDEPDKRLKLLASPEIARKFTIELAKISRDGPLEIRRIMTGQLTGSELDEEMQSGRLDEALDYVGFRFYDLAVSYLEQRGSLSFSFNGHQSLTVPLLNRLRDYAGPVADQWFRPSSENEDEVDGLMDDFALERLHFSKVRYPAHFLPLSAVSLEDAQRLLVGREGDRHLQLVVIPKPKIRALYKLDRISTRRLFEAPEGPLTCIRRRVHPVSDPSTPEIELFWIASPLELKSYVERFNVLNDMVVSVSLRALQDKNWQQQWLAVLRRFEVAILMDLDPFKVMKQWVTRHDDPMRIGRLTLSTDSEDGVRLYEVVCFLPDTANSLLYFSPVSGAVAEALSYKAKRYPTHFIEDNSFLDERRNRLLKLLSHVIHEEPFFGFGFWENRMG